MCKKKNYTSYQFSLRSCVIFCTSVKRQFFPININSNWYRYTYSLFDSTYACTCLPVTVFPLLSEIDIFGDAFNNCKSVLCINIKSLFVIHLVFSYLRIRKCICVTRKNFSRLLFWKKMFKVKKFLFCLDLRIGIIIICCWNIVSVFCPFYNFSSVNISIFYLLWHVTGRFSGKTV